MNGFLNFRKSILYSVKLAHPSCPLRFDPRGLVPMERPLGGSAVGRLHQLGQELAGLLLLARGQMPLQLLGHPFQGRQTPPIAGAALNVLPQALLCRLDVGNARSPPYQLNRSILVLSRAWLMITKSPDPRQGPGVVSQASLPGSIAWGTAGPGGATAGRAITFPFQLPVRKKRKARSAAPRLLRLIAHQTPRLPQPMTPPSR